MPNNIGLASRYAPLLDEVYKVNARSSILDTPEDRVLFTNAKTVMIYEMRMNGLSNYSRNGGFDNGSVEGEWVPYTLTKDRGTSLGVDSMDNEETINLAFGRLSGEFVRTKVAPEIDAYTFSTLANTPGIISAQGNIVPGTTNVATLIDNAEQVLNDAEVPVEGRILFVSETAWNGLKQDVDRTFENHSDINKRIVTYNEMRIIRVPKRRFFKNIQLYDMKVSGQEAGGYIIPTNTPPINFMIVHPSSIIKVAKHLKVRIWEPDNNLNADAWKFDYRIYHDTFVYRQKQEAIYAHFGTNDPSPPTPSSILIAEDGFSELITESGLPIIGEM